MKSGVVFAIIVLICATQIATGESRENTSSINGNQKRTNRKHQVGSLMQQPVASQNKQSTAANNDPDPNTSVRTNDGRIVTLEQWLQEETRKNAQKNVNPNPYSLGIGDWMSKNPILTIIFFMILPLTIISLLVARAVRQGEREITGSQTTHGSAAWANDKDLKSWEFIKKNADIEAGEFVMAKHSQFESVVLSNLVAARHCGVLGPSGTGKSRKIFMPNLHLLSNKVSMFVHDTSGELWQTSSGFWENAERFAPHEPEQSTYFNWIPLCTDENALETLVLAETIVTNGGESHSKDKFWDRTATALLAGVFAHTATTETPTPAFAYDLIAGLTLEGIEKILIESPSKLAREEAIKIKDAEDKTRKNIMSGLRSCLDFMRDERIRRFTSGTTEAVDFTTMRQKNIAVFWCLPDTLAEVLRPLTCLAIRVMMNKLKETEGNHCYLLLDEFDALGRIPKFEGDITLLRKRKVMIVCGVQSLSQLEKNYGRESAKIILEGLQSVVVLSGLKGQIAEEVSRWLGDFTLVEKAVSKNSSFGHLPSKTISVHKHARRLMTADEVRRIDENKVMIISTNKKPFIKDAYWFNEPTAPFEVDRKEVKAITEQIFRQPQANSIQSSYETRNITNKNVIESPSDMIVKKKTPMPTFPKDLMNITDEQNY